MPYRLVKVESNSDLQAFYEALTPVRVGRNNYTKADRFRDFQTVFASEQGKRVLAQLIDVAEGRPIAESEVGDHALLAYRQGQRSIGQWLVRTLNGVPLEGNV